MLHIFTSRLLATSRSPARRFAVVMNSVYVLFTRVNIYLNVRLGLVMCGVGPLLRLTSACFEQTDRVVRTVWSWVTSFLRSLRIVALPARSTCICHLPSRVSCRCRWRVRQNSGWICHARLKGLHQVILGADLFFGRRRPLLLKPHIGVITTHDMCWLAFFYGLRASFCSEGIYNREGWLGFEYNLGLIIWLEGRSVCAFLFSFRKYMQLLLLFVIIKTLFRYQRPQNKHYLNKIWDL